jgi:hypothetical protein
MTFTVPGYRVDQLLGRGSRGEVWAATEVASGRAVALKRLAIGDAAQLEAARTEAALLSALDHPSMIGLYDLLLDGPVAVLVLERADGGTLDDLLRRRGRLSVAEVGAIIAAVGAAIAHAHDAGIVHGDLSPANILFDSAGNAKLADLGVARLVGQQGPAQGTAAYLDPVLARGGVAASPASDVFSLAAVALRALTGLGPWQLFHGERAELVLARAAAGVIPALDRRLADCPSPMGAALVRALDAQPVLRGSAADLALGMGSGAPPGPVGLGAGRLDARDGPARRGRHAAPVPLAELPPHDGWQLGAGPDAQPATGRPDFARPGWVEEGVDWAVVGTNIVRPKIRDLLAEPEPGGPGRSRRRSRRRTILLAAGLAVVLAAVALVLTLTGRIPSAAGPPVPGPPVPRPPVPRPSVPRPAAMRAGPRTAVPPGRSAAREQADLADVLRGIDAIRAEAFELRQPVLLSQVYSSAALLATDRAQLETFVPAGCSLPGLLTRYTDLRILHQRADLLRVQVTAFRPPTTLRCGATVTAVAAAGPQRLSITLTRPRASWQIDSQSRVA